MKFKDKAEAFNHYRTATVEEIETRAAAISKEIDEDASADIAALNIELDGLKDAKANIEQRSAAKGKASAFNPITGRTFTEPAKKQDEDIFASTEYRGAFFKKMLGRPMSAEDTQVFERAQTQATIERRDAFVSTTGGAAVIPTQTLDQIVKKAATIGGILPYVRQFSIPANLSIPVATPESTADWHAEGATATVSENLPASVAFAAYELLKVFSLSVASNTMTIAAFEDYLSTELTRTIYAAINTAVFSGTGATQATGILPSITWGAANSATFASTGVKYTDVLGLVAKLQRGYSQGAIFAMNNATCFNRICSVVDGIGRPLFSQPAGIMQSGSGSTDPCCGYILGRPVVIDDFMPDDVILYGNFQYYGINMPQDILLEVSRESSFKQGLIDYRAMAVADGKVIVPDAFTKLTVAA